VFFEQIKYIISGHTHTTRPPTSEVTWRSSTKVSGESGRGREWNADADVRLKRAETELFVSTVRRHRRRRRWCCGGWRWHRWTGHCAL